MAIVVGVDGSEGSKEALRWALTEARLRKTTIDAVYAWSIPYLGAAYAWAPAYDEEMIASLRSTAEQLLDASIDEAAADVDGIEIRRAVVEGPPGAVLVEKAAGAEMLVVGSRGLGGFKELLLGSIGHQCAQHARCPVVIVHQPRTD
jgi:nucleotide-binding universal stress UspA family protein